MRHLINALCLLFLLPVYAQQAGQKAGSFLLQQYDEHILKITVHPPGGWQQTLFSEAVTGRPAAPSKLWRWKTEENPHLLHLKPQGVKGGVSIQYFYEGNEAGFRISLQPGEQVFGGGERAISLNRRGYRLPLYNNPSYGYSEGAESLNYSVPLFLSSRGYALFFDNPSKGYADIGKADSSQLEAAFTGGELNLYLITGATMDEQLRAYTRLTGRQPLPPRWVLGNFMSRFGYTSQEEVLKVLGKMQEEKFPVDAVILDLFWFGDSVKGTMGNLDWVSSKNWPDPKGMMDSLKAMNIKTILVTEPFILEGTKNYAEAKPFLSVDSLGNNYMLTDFYFGKGGLIDIFRKDARNWFWKKYDAQIRLGVAGWWGDLGEPEKHPSSLFHNTRDLGHKSLVGADLVHNVYGNFWSKMLYEKYRENYPARRLFFLNRAGFAGSQRYSIFPWTGDVSRSWSGLRSQLPLLQGMSVSGIPYIHSDAGGFAGGEFDPELYTRWLQMAVFTPVFRPHGTNLGAKDAAARSVPSEPVFWPDSVKGIIRNFVQLRYDMLPYNYTLAYEQAALGRPLIRPMNYYNYADHNLAVAGDQYMWGDALLVAPVIQKGASTRRVYLPRGDWYNFFTNRKESGGQWIEEVLSLNKIPVFAKAGSFVPTRPGLKNTELYKPQFLVVKHYLGREKSNYTLYNDDGQDPKALQLKNFEKISFSSEPIENGLKIRVASSDDRFKGSVNKKLIVLYVIGLNGRPEQVKMDNMMVPYREFSEEPDKFIGRAAVWDPVNGYLRVVFEYTGVRQTIKINY